ncbi:MAG TPA: serine/threonine protein kinase, partial [Gemmataceae bacterium]|nr:serine/threonine protein kinase [Gemmataceae bacterium]
MKRLIPCLSLLFISLGSLAYADNWPSWRGPDANGISKETKLPLVWDANKNIAWKLQMPGKGGSTPII